MTIKYIDRRLGHLVERREYGYESEIFIASGTNIKWG